MITRRRWNSPDKASLIADFKHKSVKQMASELDRKEKAIRAMAWKLRLRRPASREYRGGKRVLKKFNAAGEHHENFQDPRS